MNLKLLAMRMGLVILALTGTASASILQPRLGGLAYYDPVANLTWLADADYPGTSGYIAANANGTTISSYGTMTWQAANDWAAQLNVDGVTGWRLPTTLQPDPGCDGQYNNGTVSMGYNCTGSEMGNLYYRVLGNTAGSLTNTGPFSNIFNGAAYWSSTPYALDPSSSAWYFNMYDGEQLQISQSSFGYAWAVHSGDVSAVPVPVAAWLFGSGLFALAGVARRKKT